MAMNIDYIGTGEHAEYIARVYQKHCGMLHNADFEVCSQSECAAARALEVQGGDTMTAEQRAKQVLFEYRHGINPNLKDLEAGIADALTAHAQDARAEAQAEAERLRGALEYYTTARIVTDWGMEEDSDDGIVARRALGMSDAEAIRCTHDAKKDECEKEYCEHWKKPANDEENALTPPAAQEGTK